MKKLIIVFIVSFFSGKIISQCTPPSTFAVGPYYIPCGFNSVVIAAGTNSAATTYSYTWVSPPFAGMTCPSGVNCYFNSVNGAGIYTVTILDLVSGCPATNTMAVIQATTGLFVSMSGNDTICSGGTAFVSAFVSGPTTFTWSTGSNSSGIMVTPSVTTVYSVNATSMVSGCTGTGTFAVNVKLCLGVHNNQRMKNIVPGPNPNNGKFYLTVDENITNLEIQIVNSIGLEVLRQSVVQGKNEINCSLLAKGIYHYTIYQNSESVRGGKIIIE